MQIIVDGSLKFLIPGFPHLKDWDPGNDAHKHEIKIFAVT